MAEASPAVLAEPTILAPGTVVAGRYEIGAELGRGGTSIVYEARDRSSGDAVAVKLLVPPPALARIGRLRLEREVLALRRLSHPAIVQVLDFVEAGPWTCLVMRLVDGPDLGVAVRRDGALAIERVRDLARDVAGALVEAHRHGILHRDVKPQNVLLGRDGRACLTDFGSAWIEGQTTLTQTGAFVGTLDFVAPEVVAGRRGDARSDVYSLGVTLFFALAGRLPDRVSSRLPAVPAADGFRPSSVRGEVPDWLDEIVARATAADPCDRFPTAGSLLAALESADRRTSAPGPGRMGERTVSCRICGSPDPLTLGVCLGCLSRAPGPEVLLFVRPGGPEAGALVLALGRFVEDAPRSLAVADALMGAKALVAVPAAQGERIGAHLETLGVPVQRVSRRTAWSRLPGTFLAMVAGVLSVGILAGLVADSRLLWLSPALTAALTIAGVAWVASPVVARRRSTSSLPEALHAKVVDAASTMTPGAARDLLLDVAGTSRVLFDTASLDDRGRLASSVTELLASSSAAASEIQRLDLTLERLDDHRSRFELVSREWIAAHSRVAHARDTLVSQLLEALATLGAAHGDLALSPGIGEDLAACTLRLRDQVELHKRVTAEVESVLSS